MYECPDAHLIGVLLFRAGALLFRMGALLFRVGALLSLVNHPPKNETIQVTFDKIPTHVRVTM